jgi:hypothetical protein
LGLIGSGMEKIFIFSRGYSTGRAWSFGFKGS